MHVCTLGCQLHAVIGIYCKTTINTKKFIDAHMLYSRQPVGGTTCPTVYLISTADIRPHKIFLKQNNKTKEGRVGGFIYVVSVLTYNKRSLQRSKYFCYTEHKLHKWLPRARLHARLPKYTLIFGIYCKTINTKTFIDAHMLYSRQPVGGTTCSTVYLISTADIRSHKIVLQLGCEHALQ